MASTTTTASNVEKACTLAPAAPHAPTILVMTCHAPDRLSARKNIHARQVRTNVKRTRLAVAKIPSRGIPDHWLQRFRKFSVIWPHTRYQPFRAPQTT